STAVAIPAKNGLEALTTLRPTIPQRCRSSCRAGMLGTNPSSVTDVSTRERIRSESLSGQLKKFDTVAAETPAWRATSWIVTVDSRIAHHTGRLAALIRAGPRHRVDVVDHVLGDREARRRGGRGRVA